MSKKHVPVTDMTFGQLYDAVASGGEFYLNRDDSCIKIKVSVDSSLYAERESMSYGQGAIKAALSGSLKYQEVTHLVETPWTDQLDGTWENGVWCMCSDEEYPFFEKVVSYTPDVKYKFDLSTGSTARIAKPVPDDLADQLEALSKK